MQVEAERKKRAAILESEGKRYASVNVAEGQKQGTFLYYISNCKNNFVYSARILASEATVKKSFPIFRKFNFKNWAFVISLCTYFPENRYSGFLGMLISNLK